MGGDGDDVLIGGLCEVLTYPQSPSLRTDLRELWTANKSFSDRVRELSTIGVGRSRVYRLALRTDYYGVSQDTEVDTSTVSLARLVFLQSRD